MTIDNSVLFYVLFLHVAHFCLVALLVLISVLFSYLKHLLLLSLVLGAGIKVTNECNSMFGAVVHTVVHSAFYPPWDGKMSISFRAE